MFGRRRNNTWTAEKLLRASKKLNFFYTEELLGSQEFMYNGRYIVEQKKEGFGGLKFSQFKSLFVAPLVFILPWIMVMLGISTLYKTVMYWVCVNFVFVFLYTTYKLLKGGYGYITINKLIQLTVAVMVLTYVFNMWLLYRDLCKSPTFCEPLNYVAFPTKKYLSDINPAEYTEAGYVKKYVRVSKVGGR